MVGPFLVKQTPLSVVVSALSRGSGTAKKAHVGHCQASMFFKKIVFNRQLFSITAPSQMFDKVPNMLLSFLAKYKRELFLCFQFYCFLFLYYFFSFLRGNEKF